MPQMAPMSWLWLFIYFVTIFMIFNYFNYFSFLKTNKSTSNFKKNKYSLSWKW